MTDRRIAVVLAGLVVFLASSVLWNAFVHPVPRSARSIAARGQRAAPRDRRVAPVPSPGPAPAPAPAAPALAPSSTSAPVAVTPAPTVPDQGDQLSYMLLLARSEIRRRIRASAGLTYLNEIVAVSADSALHRWDNRVHDPVRVYIPSGSVANFQPSFLDAVRTAFQRWEDTGVPVRFNLDVDSTAAEVQVQWRTDFQGKERSGQTDLRWDRDGHLVRGVVTLATFDPGKRPFGPDAERVMALHEIGHLIGLDHSPDSTDIMYATPKVRDLSSRDVATALLLYQLAPGSLRAASIY